MGMTKMLTIIAVVLMVPAIKYGTDNIWAGAYGYALLGWVPFFVICAALYFWRKRPLYVGE